MYKEFLYIYKWVKQIIKRIKIIKEIIKKNIEKNMTDEQKQKYREAQKYIVYRSV